MKHYITQSQYKNKPRPVSDKPSMTVPNQSMTLKQMFERFARGESVATTQQKPIWNPNASHADPDFEKLNHADLYDKEQYSKQLAEKMAEMKKGIDADAEAKAKAKKDAEDAEWNRRLAEYEKNRSTGTTNTPGVTPH